MYILKNDKGLRVRFLKTCLDRESVIFLHISLVFTIENLPHLLLVFSSWILQIYFKMPKIWVIGGIRALIHCMQDEDNGEAMLNDNQNNTDHCSYQLENILPQKWDLRNTIWEKCLHLALEVFPSLKYYTEIPRSTWSRRTRSYTHWWCTVWNLPPKSFTHMVQTSFY